MTDYKGIFIRDELGQQPNTPSAGWSACPDMILNGEKLAPDPSIFTTTESYAKSYQSTVYTNKGNYVYLRGYNTNSSGQGSHMFFYYTQSDLMLWPKNWTCEKVTINDKQQNWTSICGIDSKGDFKNTVDVDKIGVTPQPLLWTPPPPPTGGGHSQWNHYCIILWADNNPDTPTPPDLSSFSKFENCNQLATFIQKHPNMGWRNTSDVYGEPDSQDFETGISMSDDGGTLNMSVDFVDIPDDGTFSVIMSGTPVKYNFDYANLKISDFQGGFNKAGISLPSDYKGSIRVVWNKGATKPPVSAQVRVSLTKDSSPLLVKLMNDSGIRTDQINVHLFQATHNSQGERVFDLSPTPVVLLGRQTWNLKYGVKPPTPNS